MSFAPAVAPPTSVFHPARQAAPASPISDGASASLDHVGERTVAVFDWDDTLCPSSWLQAQDLLPHYRGQDVSFSALQQQALTKLAHTVVKLLLKAVSYGPVFVVTAAEGGWVELSCSLYLPAVQNVLSLPDVHIVSARSWYEQTYGQGGDASSWKHAVMQLIARKCFDQPHQSSFNFVSVGDSVAERNACHAAAAHVPYTLAKTLKFVDQPTSDEVAQQVELTHDSFEQMCAYGAMLDLHLSRDQLDQLRGAFP